MTSFQKNDIAKARERLTSLLNHLESFVGDLEDWKDEALDDTDENPLDIEDKQAAVEILEKLVASGDSALSELQDFISDLRRHA